MFQTKKTYVSAEMKMPELIFENPSFLVMMEHFNLDLATQDKSVEQICQENLLNNEVFIAIANLYNGFNPGKNPVSMGLPAFSSYDSFAFKINQLLPGKDSSRIPGPENVNNIFNYMQGEKHLGDTAFMYAPVFGTMVYRGADHPPYTITFNPGGTVFVYE